MQIHVQGGVHSFKMLTLVVEPWTTIGEVKRQIWEQTSIQIEDMCGLMLNGQPDMLANECTLSHYKVEHESMFHFRGATQTRKAGLANAAGEVMRPGAEESEDKML